MNDWATAALMEHFYRFLASTGDAARALAGAQRALAAGSATADPYYWAGFVLVGGAPDSSGPPSRSKRAAGVRFRHDG